MPSVYESSPYRWWAVWGLILVGATQSTQWNTYSPIAPVVHRVYGWDDNFIAMLTNAANIPFTATCMIWMAAAERLGLRRSLMISMAFLVLCAGIRCLTIVAAQWTSPIAVAAMMSNGLSAPPLNFLPPVVSETWFPSSQRGTATALGNNAVYLGVALGFIFGPLLVPAEENGDAARARLSILWLGHLVWALALFAILAISYPAKPPTPPSVSATYRAEHATAEQLSCRSMLRDICAVLRVGQFLVILFTYMATIAMYQVQQSYLGVIMKNVGVSEGPAAWLGFCGALSGCGGCILMGGVADRIGAMRMKLAAAACQILAAASLSAFALEATQLRGTQTLPLLYVFGSAGSFFLNATVPLYFELGMECTFPLPESGSSAAFVFFQGVQQTVLLALPFDRWGTTWLLWALPIALVPSGLLLAFTKIRYRRASLERRPTGVAPLDPAPTRWIQPVADGSCRSV